MRQKATKAASPLSQAYCTPSYCKGRASARANPVAARLRSTSRDSSRATRLPSCADYILRLQDTKPESLEISMLRLLLVALQLDFALPAALDEQEANAIQFVVQSTLQFEVRSPPESRPLLPAAARDQHTTAPPHAHLRTHNTQAHTSPCTRRGTRARARRSTPRSTTITILFEPRDTNPPPAGVPGPASSHACSAHSFRSAMPLRARPVHMLQMPTRTRAVRSRASPNYVPAERRAGLRATQLALAISTCERAAMPVLLTACALLARCRQPRLRAVGPDGHRALDLSAMNGRRGVDTTVTR
jgi:hypothetical protein